MLTSELIQTPLEATYGWLFCVHPVCIATLFRTLLVVLYYRVVPQRMAYLLSI